MSVLFPTTINIKSRTFTRVKGKSTVVEIAGTITGSVQPLNGRDFEALDTGRQDKGTMKVYCNEKLNVSIEGTTTPGDIVIYRGTEWEVVQELPYQNSIINHNKYIVEQRGQV